MDLTKLLKGSVIKVFFCKGLGLNKKKHLTINGCDTVELAQKFGTPLYVMDEDVIRENCKSYKESLKKHYQGNGLPIFASKAFNCLEMCRIIKDEGLGLDVVSGGELYTALKAGFSPEKIHFHGNNKTEEELEMAIDAGVGRIVADNFFELKRISNIAKKRAIVCNISLRIKPGIDAHTHDFIRTGQIDSKFGFALETGEAIEAVKFISKIGNICLKGIHCHIGSQILEIDPFIHSAKVMMDFIKTIKDETGILIKELNLGGGFGIKYTDEDEPPRHDEYIECISKVIKLKSEEHKIPLPILFIEPGRSIVGEAGITLYKIGAIKEIPGVRTYVSVDGGMCDNPRYALYKSKYTVLLADKAGEKPSVKVTVAGKCCESGDLIQENVVIQAPEIGDILAVLSTGAYNYSMASNYNRIPKPAVVMVKGNVPRVVVKRQSFDDIIEDDI